MMMRSKSVRGNFGLVVSLAGWRARPARKTFDFLGAVVIGSILSALPSHAIEVFPGHGLAIAEDDMQDTLLFATTRVGAPTAEDAKTTGVLTLTANSTVDPNSFVAHLFAESGFSGWRFTSSHDLVPVPEPTVVFGALGLLGLVVFREGRRAIALAGKAEALRSTEKA